MFISMRKVFRLVNVHIELALGERADQALVGLEVVQGPQGVFRGAPAEVFRETFPVRGEREPAHDEEGVEAAPETLGAHHEGDGEDPYAHVVVPPAVPHLGDGVADVLVDGSIVHDDKDVPFVPGVVQGALLVEEGVHELRTGQPVEEEARVPVLTDDGHVVRLGPPGAADD